MNKGKDRNLIYQMIDELQKKIMKNPKGKIYMIEELEALQQDLKDLVSQKIGKPKSKKGESSL